MPELPEVESVCRQLATVVTGLTILQCQVALPRIIRQGNLDLLVGQKFSSVKRIGKFIRIDTFCDLVLFIHLRMTGQLLWEPPDHLRDRYVRCVIQTDRGSLYYRDVRTLGGLWITSADQPPWKDMGVDPFDSEFNGAYLKKHMLNHTIPIKQLLLDQSIIAGIGNIYASEILFDSKINPIKSGKSLTQSEISRLHQSVIRILSKAIAANGTTFRDFRLSNGREGEFQDFLQVYGHENDPCSHCAQPITRIVQSGRSSYFCPVCQGAD